MHFGRPDNLYFLLLLAPMALAFGWFLWWKRDVRRRIGHAHLIQAMSGEHSPARQLLRGLLVMLAFALLCVAAAQPQWGQDNRPIKRFGVDVVFALDLSKSMLAQDVAPSRLEAAKSEISNTLKQLEGDRSGLVIFTAVSFAQSPLTSDYGAIRFYLDKLHPAQMPVGGTSLGQAMREGKKLLLGEEESRAEASGGGENKAGAGHSIKRAKNQLIVLISDGEDHESAPLEVARAVRDEGIHVVTVGFGSPEGSKIPVLDEQGNLTGYQRDRKGELIETRLDEQTLKQIAQITGGTYLHYAGKNSIVNGVTDYINQLEKSELESMLREHYKDRFMYFLTPALLLLLLAVFLGERRSTDENKRPSLKKMRRSSSLIVWLVLLLAAGGSTGCEEVFRATLGTVDEANQLVDEEKYQEALEKYQHAQTQVPTTPELHYDLGVGHLGVEDYSEARRAFARALASDDPALRFDALFNMGLSLARQEKWRDALESYKQALKLPLNPDDPAHAERVKHAQHNLEVIFRELFPPCAELEDDFEPNDDPESATRLEELNAEGLTLCGENDDWYIIPALAGSHVEVSADFSQLRDEPDPEHVFLPRPEDLQLSVFNATGERVVAVDQGDADSFEPNSKRARREIERFEVTPEMLQGEGEHLLLKISAAAHREFKYDLDIAAIPPCQALEDEFEPNDTAAEAAAIDQGSHQLHICPENEDWFKVDLEMGDSFFIDLQAGEDMERERAPELELEIRRADTNALVSSAYQDGPFLTAGVQEVAQAGTYLIRVSGQTDDEQGPYSADIYHYIPCPAGDDRFEPNDTPATASELDPSQPHLRYLRLCDQNPDFFKLPAQQDDPAQSGKKANSKKPEDRAISWGLSLVGETLEELNGEPAAAEDSDAQLAPDADAQGSDNKLHFDLLSLSGDRIIAQGEPAEVVEAEGPAQQNPPADLEVGEDKNSSLPDLLLQHENPDNESYLMRAQGPETFYHLTQLNPQNQDQSQDEEQEQNDQDQDGQDQDEDDQDEEQDEGTSDEEDSDEDADEQQSDEGESGEEDPAERDEDQDPQESGEREDPESAHADEEDTLPDDPDDRRMNEILRALEQNDDNFQMKKALENMPRRHIEKDW